LLASSGRARNPTVDLSGEGLDRRAFSGHHPRMPRFAAAVVVATLAGPGAPGPARADEAPLVVLHTMGPGESAFEAFGHVALCVEQAGDARSGWCFDYGTAYFEDFAGLIWGFLRGEAEFQMTALPERMALGRFLEADRTIWRQELPLTPDQARAVANKLWADARDPGWRYRYDHFHDNCATRLRDVLDGALGGALRAATAGRPGPGESFRNLGRRVFGAHEALLVMSDLLVGRAVDAVPDRWEAMFLPDLLRAELERYFGVPAVAVYRRHGPDPAPEPGWGGRGWLVVLAVVLAAPLAAARRLGRRSRVAAWGAIVPLVLLGLMVWTMSIVSNLPAVRWNEMLLVLVPFDLAAVLLPERLARGYARGRVAELVLVALLLAIGVLRQALWVPLLVPLAPLAVLAFVPCRPAEERGVREAGRDRAAAAGEGRSDAHRPGGG
jgi:hypothetical protein